MAGTDEVRLVTGSLNAEAAKWRGLSEQMRQVMTAAGRLELSWSAFFFADVVSTSAHARAYDDFQDWMVSLLRNGSAEFAQLAEALDTAAEQYRRSDGKAATDLSAIYGRRR